MAKILIALSTCHEAFVSAPLVRAVREAGHDPRIAWFGSERGLADARRLGLPDIETLRPRSDEGSALQRATELAGRACTGCDLAVTVGHGAFAVALAEAAREHGALVVRIGAGERTGGVADRDRRVADHTADRFCVTSDGQRYQLLHEGVPTAAIRVVGSLLAQALETRRRPAPAANYFWLALEHQASVADRETLRRLLGECVRAAGRLSLAVRAAPTVLRPALDQHALEPPAGCEVADGADALSQLDAACAAVAIVTDSIGYQELAAVLGIPCVVLAHAGARPDLAAAGRVQIAEPGPGGIEHAFARCSEPTPGSGASGEPLPAQRVLRAVDDWLGTAAEPAHEGPSPIGLPSDDDASGRTLGDAEIALVTAALRAGKLNSTRGTFVPRFESDFAGWLGTRHAIACASGTAAVHCAIAALGLAAGDEVITTPITDMGALTPILYEGGVPVFADVDPATLNVTADAIAAQITGRTRAIVVTHLFGGPCGMDAILALAQRHQLKVIEDAAQAFGATWRGNRIGTLGHIGAFSLQQGKHITTGEGGIVCTDDDELARRVRLFVNKAWGYGDPEPDHYFPALNYRMTELQGAVACAQLPKLADVVRKRREVAAGLRDGMRDLPGVQCPDDPPHGTHAYWKFAFRVDSAVVPGGATALGGRMRAQGIACVPRYVQKPAFECQVFRDWRRSPVSSLPLAHNARGAVDGPLFDRRDYPGAVAGLDQVVVLPINERYAHEHVVAVARAIRTAHQELTA